MHASSALKVRAFLDVFAPAVLKAGGNRVLDIGSAAYGGGTGYRKMVETAGLHYTGLDMQAGENVDIVSKHPLVYDELATESFDMIISGQTFEHNPYFWVTFCEVARLLKQGGHVMIVAPSAGAVHRFPYDCWRFYPDSWAVLCSMSGLTLVEVLFEPKTNVGRVRGAQWGDSAVVATKPRFETAAELDAFHARLAELTAPFRSVQTDIKVPQINAGSVWDAYERYVAAMARRLKALEQAGAKAEPEVGN